MSNNGAWNLTVDDSSPMVKYLPYVSNDPSSAWALHNSVSGFDGNDGGALLANSSHATWSNRTSIHLEFFGSAIYLYGEANCTYDIAIDGVPRFPSLPNGSLLASFPRLALGPHVLTLKPRPDGSPNSGFAFDKALVTLNSSSGEADRDVYENRNSTIIYSGPWHELNNKSIPSALSPAPYHQGNKGSLASLPFYGDTVVVEGPLGWNFSQYSIVLDKMYLGYNGTSEAVVGNTVLFFATGLDPNVPHMVSLLSNMGGSESTVGLNSITVYGSQGRIADPSEFPTFKPTIVPILASMMALIIILQFLGASIYVRRQREKTAREAANDLEAAKSGERVAMLTPPNVTSATLKSDSKIAQSS